MKKTILIVAIFAVLLVIAGQLLKTTPPANTSAELSIASTDKSSFTVALTSREIQPISSTHAQSAEQQTPASATNKCTWRVEYRLNESGQVTPVGYCERSKTGHSDPYRSFSNRDLENLAYGDAVAAERLAMRLRDTDEKKAMTLFLRAAALTGDGSPLIAYHNAYRYPMFKDDQPVLRGIRARYVLRSIAETVDGEPWNLESMRSIIHQHFDDPEAEIARLDRQAESFIEQVQNVQIEVTGATTIGKSGGE